MSKAILIIGGTGTGKSTFVKERINNVSKKSLFIHDVNKEYFDYSQHEFTDASSFTAIASNLENGVIIFEEATIFFRSRGQDEKMLNILVRKRHTNNTIFLVFHSLRSVPKYIYELVNYIVLFKTNDNAKNIEQKFEVPELTQTFERVQESKNQHYYEIFEVQGNVMTDKKSGSDHII